MKRILVCLFSLVLSASLTMAQEQLDFNRSAIPEVKTLEQPSGVTSNHSLSLTILGLEYSYEQALGGQTSLILRAGLPCGAVYATDHYQGTNTIYFGYGPTLGVSLEPRYYFNLKSRYEKGKATINNSANFISIQSKLYADAEGYAELSVIPTFGIRRGSKHWFREYTFGVAYHTISSPFCPVFPHLGFRLGYKF